MRVYYIALAAGALIVVVVLGLFLFKPRPANLVIQPSGVTIQR
jgi:hypothetical protein